MSSPCKLVTKRIYSLQSLQASTLRELEESLKDHSVTLTVQYSDTLHDREVRYTMY